MRSLNRVRSVLRCIRGVATQDGEGVRLTRYIGSPQLDMLDPFLLLDHFESDHEQDDIGGFPDHPHRGFEAVSYLLAGKMHHKDSVGHEGVIEPYGVQWMTAGKGVVHSEIPEQIEGKLNGFQLWINLPAHDKMVEPAYQEFAKTQIPLIQTDGLQIRLISGQLDSGETGPVYSSHTRPTYMHVVLEKGRRFEYPLDPKHNAFIYAITGAVLVGDSNTAVNNSTLAVLSPGDLVVVTSDEPSEFLLVAGQPLNEPVVRAGPFVMNSREQILQAFRDFQSNRF